jgi:hypothetical protein
MDANMPLYLTSTFDLIRCAYPEKIPEEDYFALLFILYNRLSFRNIGLVIEFLTGECKYVAYNNALAAQSDKRPDQNEVDRVLDKLIICGYDRWVQEED